MMNNKICKKILVTGGACAGKTESLEYIQSHLSKLGYNIYIVNEIPTMLILGGITPRNIGKMNFLKLVYRHK